MKNQVTLESVASNLLRDLEGIFRTTQIKEFDQKVIDFDRFVQAISPARLPQTLDTLKKEVKQRNPLHVSDTKPSPENNFK